MWRTSGTCDPRWESSRLTMRIKGEIFRILVSTLSHSCLIYPKTLPVKVWYLDKPVGVVLESLNLLRSALRFWYWYLHTYFLYLVNISQLLLRDNFITRSLFALLYASRNFFYKWKINSFFIKIIFRVVSPPMVLSGGG